MRYLRLLLIFAYTIFGLAFLITGAIYVQAPNTFDAYNWDHEKMGHALLIDCIAFIATWLCYYLLKRADKF